MGLCNIAHTATAHGLNRRAPAHEIARRLKGGFEFRLVQRPVLVAIRLVETLVKLTGPSAADSKIRAEWSELLNGKGTEPTILALIAEASSLRKFKDLNCLALKQLAALAKGGPQGGYF